MASRKTLLVVLVVILLLAAGGFAYYKFFYQSEEVAEVSPVQTSRVRQGDITNYVSGTGTLIVGKEIGLGFGTNGTVAELYVQVGDEVQAGDVLAVQADLEQLKAAIASDQLAVNTAQNAIDDLYANADLVAAQAQLQVAEAKEALDTAQYTWYVQQEGNRASTTTIEAAKAELVLAQQKLDAARDEYNLYYGKPKDSPGRALATTKLAQAQKNYDSALRNLNWYLGHPTETQQALLDADVALAMANLAVEERNYERVKDGPDPDDVAKAELELEDAEAQLAVSQGYLDESTIVAPVDGTILTVTADVGEDVNGNFITMADLSQLYLEIYLDETDMGNIKVGYETEAVFDALPDLVYPGQVIQVDPSLYRSGMLSTVRGLVELEETSTATFDQLLIGMSAAVDVIEGRAEGVMIVPVEAVRELSPGEYAVFVQNSDGELELRSVEVGLSDMTFIEIKSGLEVGETVSTGIVETE
jgi:HlyD family secretion protein